MRHAVRIAQRPMLEDYLANHVVVEFWTKTDGLYGASERTWPNSTYETLILAEHQWRREIGRVIDIARQTACVMDSGQHYCVVKLHYDRVADQPIIEEQILDSLSPPSPSSSEASGGRACDVVAAPARSFPTSW